MHVSRGSFTISNSFILFFLWALERTVGNVQNYFWTSTEYMGFERESMQRSMPVWEILVLIFVHLQIQKEQIRALFSAFFFPSTAVSVWNGD